MWFLDASVMLAGEDADDEHHEAARRLLTGSTPLATLDLAFYEVANVAIRAWRDGGAAHRLRNLVDAIALDGGLTRVDAPLVAHATQLAVAHTLSAYDAAYVAGAAQASAPLVSCDVRDLAGRELARTPEQALDS